MTKEKKTPYSYRYRIGMRLLKIVAGVVGLFLCGSLSCGLITYAYMSNGEIKPSLDPSLLSTAEYLYEYPQPTLEYLQVNSRTSDRDNSICYGDVYEEDEAGLYKTKPRLGYLGGEFFLNGSQVPLIALNIEMGTYLTRPGIAFRIYCLNAIGLSKGLHLAELRLKSFVWEAPYRTFQWAVMVE